MNPPPYRPPGIPGALHANWQSISVRPWSLARLKEDINPLFRAGKIVALSNELYAEYRTPTKYEGQGPPNLNASTRVRVYLWEKEIQVEDIPSQEGGKPFSIQHRHLVHPVTFTTGPRGGWTLDARVKLRVPSTDPGAVTYMTAKFPVGDPRGQRLRIPDGTVGVVAKCMTATNVARTADQQLTSTRADWWYIINLSVRQTRWRWVRCQEHVSVLALEPLQSEEAAIQTRFIRSNSGPPELTVVSKTTPGQNA